MTPSRAIVALLLLPALVRAGESVDLEMMTRLRDEGFNRSQVMETAATLTDVIGPRLTGSPAQRRASEWARQKLSEWGLSNARLETWGTVIMAAFAWNAANREALLPRKPLPKP